MRATRGAAVPAHQSLSRRLEEFARVRLVVSLRRDAGAIFTKCAFRRVEEGCPKSPPLFVALAMAHGRCDGVFARAAFVFCNNCIGAYPIGQPRPRASFLRRSRIALAVIAHVGFHHRLHSMRESRGNSCVERRILFIAAAFS